jgi:copper chaperone CopZ
METVEFSVQGLHNSNGADDLENALTGLSGIAHIETDVPARTISIRYDPAYTNRDYIARTIKGVGYPVRRTPAQRREGAEASGAELETGEPAQAEGTPS